MNPCVLSALIDNPRQRTPPRCEPPQALALPDAELLRRKHRIQRVAHRQTTRQLAHFVSPTRHTRQTSLFPFRSPRYARNASLNNFVLIPLCPCARFNAVRFATALPTRLLTSSSG